MNIFPKICYNIIFYGKCLLLNQKYFFLAAAFIFPLFFFSV